MRAIPSGLGVRRLQAPRPRAAVGLQIAVQLDQRLAVYLALEVDDALERDPVVVPAPGVELGMPARTKFDITVAADHPQEEPDLLLAAVGALAQGRAGVAVARLGAPHPLLRDFVP